MSTNVFDRDLTIKDPEDVRRFREVIGDNKEPENISKHPYYVNRGRSERLLSLSLSHR